MKRNNFYLITLIAVFISCHNIFSAEEANLFNVTKAFDNTQEAKNAGLVISAENEFDINEVVIARHKGAFFNQLADDTWVFGIITSNKDQDNKYFVSSKPYWGSYFSPEELGKFTRESFDKSKRTAHFEKAKQAVINNYRFKINFRKEEIEDLADTMESISKEKPINQVPGSKL